LAVSDDHDRSDFVGDEIGVWSEIKLEIIRKYAAAYSRILSSRRKPAFEHLYIDGFAGSGQHRSRTTGELVAGSPIRALEVDPPFREYHFVDLQAARVESLRQLARERENVYLYEGNANEILLSNIFPRVRYDDYRRALCLLDPYGMQLEWRVLEAAGKAKSLEVFVNFPIMDINRNVLRRDARVDPAQAERLTMVWGDESWRDIAYGPPAQGELFEAEALEKRGNEAVAEAFRVRLRDVAGFGHVADPIPMRNARGATLYYLYFASQQPVAKNIVDEIFNLYRDAGGR
jgi:three-Cys-motif partner protein